MKISAHGRRLLLLVLTVGALVIAAAVAIAPVRDLLAVVVALALVGIFVVIRLVAAPLARSSDRPWDLWGGMGTHDELWSGHLPDQPPGRVVLPDAEPSIDGHRPGQGRANPP